MLDEENFHGADLAGGEGEIPLAIMRVTDPVIRREVRNAHYNLGHPSTATLLRIMRRSGASDAAQRYARWCKYYYVLNGKLRVLSNRRQIRTVLTQRRNSPS